MNSCTVNNCEKRAWARGRCNTHYARLRRQGPLPPAEGRSLVQRFFEKVQVRHVGCWVWTATRIRKGYGHFHTNGGMVTAHRMAYELLTGPIPEGKTLDHLCRNRICVRPDHLEPVDMRTNILRGNGLAAQNARKVSCPVGHQLIGENLYRHKDGRRECLSCRRESLRRAAARQRAKKKAKDGTGSHVEVTA